MGFVFTASLLRRGSSIREDEVVVFPRCTMKEPMDYASSGVDIDLEGRAVASLILSLIHI